MAESSGKVVSNNVNLQVENKPVECNEAAEENKTETVMEPMLLEEYQPDNVPRTLQNLLGHFTQEGVTLDKNDIAVIFIYIMMLETGFVTSEFIASETELDCSFHYKRLLSLTNMKPRNWKTKNGTYSLSFILAPYPSKVCTLICIPMGDDLLVNGYVKSMYGSYQNVCMLMDLSMYVVNTSGLFQNLPSLSRKFKTDISNPCKLAILPTYLLCANLDRLPSEVFEYLKKFCDKKTVRNLDRI